MENLKPITWTPRPLRVIWHISAVLVAALTVFATSVDAGQRQARLSSDLSAHLDSGSGADVDVIVSGSVEKIARLAERHGLHIKRQLEFGAVFTVSTQSLEALSQDVEVEALSGNSRVHSSSALTTDSTSALTTHIVGADAAWAGEIETLGEVDGRGIGVAIIDSGIATENPALQNRVIASVDFVDRERGKGHDFYGHGTHIAGIIAARKYNQPVAGADSGMAPAAHLINL